jgi:aspartate beta-hydroxylase
MAVIEGLELANAPPHTPEAFFSILKPGTHIPPHYGLSNFKLAVHLALMIPDSCGIRVGGETRYWQEGRCLVFDDSFEHEAWNRSNTLRAVLIVEAWNPALTGIERAAIGRIIAASERFNAQWAA